MKAVATIGAPFDATHVKHLLADGTARPRWTSAAGASRCAKASSTTCIGTTSARIRALRRALLVLHATADDTVGIDNAAAIFQVARHPKSFVTLNDANHLLTRRPDADYAAEVIAWASRSRDLGPQADAGDPASASR